MIAIDTNFAVARYPIPLRSRLRRPKTDFQPVCRSGHNISYFFPATTGADHISICPDAARSISAHTYKIDTFSNSGASGTHVLREDFNGAPGRHAARHHDLSVAAKRRRVCQVQAQTSKSVPAERSAILRARGNGQNPFAQPRRACLRPR